MNDGRTGMFSTKTKWITSLILHLISYGEGNDIKITKQS